MPFFFKIYIVIFIFLLISNIIFHSKFKMKVILLIYEIFSAIYMIGMIYAYWNPFLLGKLNIITIIPLFFILCVDIYLTTIGSLKDLGIDLPDMSKKSQETAKIISILFNAPAYIVGILASLQILKINNMITF